MQIGDRFVQLGLRTELVAACRRERSLALEHPIYIRLAVVEFPLLRLVLLYRILTRDRGCSKTGFGCAKSLQGISNIHLDVLFKLLSLCPETFALNQRSPVLSSRRFVTEERQIELNTDAECRIFVREDIRERCRGPTNVLQQSLLSLLCSNALRERRVSDAVP